MAQQHRGLLDVGNGGAPGTGLAQRARKLGRHRRLGVGSNGNAGALAPLQEEVAIGGEGGLVEGEGGKGKIATRRSPALAADVLNGNAIDQGNAPCRRGQALVFPPGQKLHRRSLARLRTAGENDMC